MNPITTYRPQTYPQKQLLDRVDRAGRATLAHARSAARLEGRAARIRAEVTDREQRHPEWTHADGREVATSVLLLGALVAGVALDDVITAPVAEHLLRQYAGLDGAVAAAGRYVLPVLLITVELGVGLFLALSVENERKGATALWTLVGLVFVIAMPLLVGETEHVASLNRRLEAGEAIDAVGLFAGPIPLVTLATMAWACAVHAFIVFGPHHNSLAYGGWALRRLWSRGRARRAEEQAQRHLQAAGDCRREYQHSRTRYLNEYPGWTMPELDLSALPAPVREAASESILAPQLASARVN